MFIFFKKRSYEVVRDILKNRYIIPLDFVVISNHMPLLSHLQIIFELTINKLRDGKIVAQTSL